MQLSQLKEIIQKYKDGTATQEECEIIEQWLARAGERDLSLVSAETGVTEDERNAIEARILGKLQQAIQDRPRAKVTRLRWVRVAAAAAILLAVAGVALFSGGGGKHSVAMLSAHSGPYEIKHIVLPDSTVVALYHNSTITWPAEYTGNERPVQLTGQAYFDVAKDAEKTFIVHNGSLDIKVLGTSFIVNDQLHQTNVHLLTGKVSIGVDGQLLATLMPRQMIQYNKDSKIAQTGFFDTASISDWLDKRLIFRETALADVWAAIGSQFGVKVNAPALSGAVFTGEFNDRDELKNVLDVVTVSTGLKYKFTSDSTINISK